jgi:hypothetical protein
MVTALAGKIFETINDKTNNNFIALFQQITGALVLLLWTVLLVSYLIKKIAFELERLKGSSELILNYIGVIFIGGTPIAICLIGGFLVFRKIDKKGFDTKSYLLGISGTFLLSYIGFVIFELLTTQIGR